jgi:hypothetical protein
MGTVQERLAVAERVIDDHGKDIEGLALVPQGLAMVQAEVAALRADVKAMRDEKTSSKATTAALIIAAMSAFATLGAAALTLLGTAPS